MLSHAVRARDAAAGSVRRNLFLLACAIPVALVIWTAIGELIGDVFQSDSDDGLVLDAVLFVVSMLYISLILFFLFLPGFALFLLVLRLVDRRFRLSARGHRLVAVALSPLIGAVFFLIPAVPEDQDGVWSGWWFILGTGLIVALVARLPRRQAPRSN
jgi:hypothetical protein